MHGPSLGQDSLAEHSPLGGTSAPSLVGGLPRNQLAQIEEVLHAVQDSARLVRSQPFSIEGVENLLNETVGDFSREVGLREGLIVPIVRGVP